MTDRDFAVRLFEEFTYLISVTKPIECTDAEHRLS